MNPNNYPLDSSIHQKVHQEPGSQINLKDARKLERLRSRTTVVENRDEEDLVYERIKNSRFKQQNLPAWRPVPTILTVVIVLSLFGIIFIILGIVLLVYSNKIKSVELDYTNCGTTNLCNRTINIDENIDGPVFVYYQLDGFFQNSRRYLKSKNMDQLQGKEISDKDDCSPAIYNKDMDFGDKTSLNNTALSPNDVAIPCGLMAKTFFNDTYDFSINGEPLFVNETEITFAKDRDLYKKNYNTGKQWMDLTNEHFIVWMRPSGLPNPKKLWGRIERDLESGTKIDVAITNNYNVDFYEGKKKIILSNANKFGGKNKVLGISYIVVGGLSIICAILFPIGYKLIDKEKYL